MELSSGNSIRKSKMFQAKVNTGLPVPLILGMPFFFFFFLATQHIAIDSNAHTTKDKRTGYDLLNPKIPKSAWAPKRVVPPPMPPKTCQQPNTTLVSVSEPALAGYLLPAPIMAAICERIETISLQDKLLKK